jgi:hypothetical protein
MLSSDGRYVASALSVCVVENQTKTETYRVTVTVLE